ncbi:carbohydrate ABC transporter membrane protein 1 (CUT1 family) [Kineothrix alysoides]|uniref:Carbohydrate ABC transporter membrane protein 1 (CUT1 family) n=1 Tax=Kineothrix alysoides TaxID=1469948 RepID=A0A4R1QLS2_9FIRM|nr:sugar ABC transporter permease [Kineothrix alysoides]TCL54586.1 carbohydrate ABC transporter membrane protein 1 (CUT1 family) [Kineothrix alysoides]
MKNIKKFFKYDNAGIFFVLPALAYMLAFVGYPIIYNFILSFQDVTARNLKNGIRDFIGFKNYIDLFTQDNVLTASLWNTLVFTVSCLVFQFIVGFALAVFFNKKFAFSKPVRGLLMMPWMIPITITGLIFKFMFGTDVGIINYFLKTIGLIGENVEWLTSTTTAMPAVIFANIWIGIPFNMILIATGLTIIPTELYESASIDGANKLQSFWRITVPLLKPTIESVLILGFIYTFKVYDLIYVMTSGGPVNSTQVLSTYSYKLSFEMFKYSKGAAVANILFVILFLISLAYLKYVYTEEEA